MKRLLFVLCIFFVLFSCSTKQVSTKQTDYSKIVKELRELASHYEKTTEIYRDSLMKVKGLMEKSSNVTDSTSHLETSYSLSDAAIKDGKLYHSIENKDSIPTPIKTIYKKVEVHDTLYINSIDTVYIEKEKDSKVVVQKKRFGENFFYTCGWIASIAVIGTGVWFLYKVKKDKG